SGNNNSGQVVGYFTNGSTSQGFLRSTGGSVSIISAPGASDTFASDINASGEIVGYSFGGTYQGFILVGNTFSPLNVPGATDTLASASNNVGEIVGSYDEGGSSPFQGFLDNNGVFST